MTFPDMDNLSKSERSDLMRKIKSKNTKPERIVRSIIHKAGFRFRLHAKDLPGKPDLVLPRLSKVINVNGCFWHGHKCSLGDRTPKSNIQFWVNKIEANKARDIKNRKKLSNLGWSVKTIWECQLNDHDKLLARLSKFLNAARN